MILKTMVGVEIHSHIILETKKLKYPYIHFPKTSDESAIVSSSSLGNIQKINIKTPGESYKVGDTLNFNNRSTTGVGA